MTVVTYSSQRLMKGMTGGQEVVVGPFNTTSLLLAFTLDLYISTGVMG